MASSAERRDIASAAHRLVHARVGARERRRFRRAPLIVTGRMLDPLGREHDCRTADISPGDVRFAAPILPEVGHRVVLYLDGLGRVSGNVARRCGETEVAVIFEQSSHKREKLAEALTFTMNKKLLGLSDSELALPPGVKQLPTGPHRIQTARVQFETGEILDGEVLDFSLAGMTIRSDKIAPPLGSWVRVGNTYGRVARRIEGGFAIDFERRGPLWD